MKKSIALSTAALLSCSLLQAAEIKADGKDAGDVELMFKAMHIIDDKENGFAPSNGSGYLVKLKYDTPDILTDGLKIGVGMYANGDTGRTEWDEFAPAAGQYNKPAKGMFVSNRGESKALMGEAYVSYKNDSVHAKLGRQILKTPLTEIKWSLMPNFYEAYTVGTNAIEGFSLTATWMTKMSFGSRAMTDWGLIGERTGTAGVSTFLTVDSGNAPGGYDGFVDQAKFYDMGVAALGTGNSKYETDGRGALGATYKGKNLKVDLWAYHAPDIVNDYYAQIGYALPVAEGMKVKLQGQYLAQRNTGDHLAVQKSAVWEGNYEMFGAKLGLGTKKWGVYGAYEQSGDKGQFFNAWGADPSYTSSLFSRNVYRKDVGAYKIGAHYKIMKGLKFMASYANYGKSKTTLSNSPAAGKDALTDAVETDLVLVYKPTKAWMFKIFNAIRTSEYDGTTSTKYTERKMNHWRAVASYTF